jgi:hypothetical protein
LSNARDLSSLRHPNCVLRKGRKFGDGSLNGVKKMDIFSGHTGHSFGGRFPKPKMENPPQNRVLSVLRNVISGITKTNQTEKVSRLGQTDGTASSFRSVFPKIFPVLGYPKQEVNSKSLFDLNV